LGLKLAGKTGERLPSLLRDYTEQFRQMHSLPVEMRIAASVENLELPAETEVQLVRIVQEALTNIRKHARASRAEVRLSNGGPNLEIIISDDGQGFDPETARAAHRPHFGLSTMRERAEAIGAEFLLESQPGRGTQIAVHLPLKSHSL
jgi:signal transduction histidine kinase